MKKELMRAVSVILAVFLILPQIMFGASALTFNGTASSSGDGSSAVTSTGGYAIPSNLTQNTNRAVGYRFTVIDGVGNAKKACFDVFRYNTYIAYSSYYAGYSKFDSKMPKTYYRTNYTGGTYTTSTTMANVCHDSNMGLTLPEDTTGIEAWCTNANMGVVLSHLWGITVSTLEQNSWGILIEPIFALKIENVVHAMTVTEIGVYGAAKFGSSSTGGSSYNSNTWGFISNYTNKHMPNSLRLTSAYAGIPAAEQTSSRLSFGNIVTGGYGAAVVYGEYLEQSPEIIRWTYHQTSYDGFTVYLYTLKAAQVKVPTWTSAGGQDDIVWYNATSQESVLNGAVYNWVVYIPKSNHNNELGYYTTHFYAYSAGGKYVSAGGGYQPPTVTGYTVTQRGSEGFVVYANTESSERFLVSIWTEQDGQDDQKWHYPEEENNTVAGVKYTWKLFVPFTDHYSELGLYNIHFYVGNYYSENLLGAKTTFTPDTMWELRAEYIRVYDDDQYICFGTSVGPTFDDFDVIDGYPQYGYSTSFSVFFPPGETNNYVRHSVWIEGEEENASISDEYSWDTVWIDLDITPDIIDENTESYTVCAKVDLLDSYGNVMQQGSVYYFYVPIRPTVIGNGVSAESITGETVAHSGYNENYGKLYAGQRIYPVYHFESYNTFNSPHNLYTNIYEFEDSEQIDATIKYANQPYDMVSENTPISSSSPVSGHGTLCPYTVIENDYYGNNEMAFMLWAYWSKDSEVYPENSIFFMPIVTADIALDDIKLVDGEGYIVDPTNLIAGQELTVRYYYANNTEVTVYVNGYNDDESMIGGIFAIPAGETISVEGAKITVPSEDFAIWGGVYLEGAGIYNTEYESNGDNNELLLECSVSSPLEIAPIEPNAPYRENTTVISSFWIINGSSTPITPSSNISVNVKVYNAAGSVIAEKAIENIVIPANDKNLIYCSWAVPEGLSSQNVTVTGQIGGDTSSLVSMSVPTVPYIRYSTPDTKYEEKAPSGFYVPDAPEKSSGYATWCEYEYTDGEFIKQEYGIGVNSATDEELIRGDPYADTEDSYMKSGYVYCIFSEDKYSSVSGYLLPKSYSYTDVQYVLIRLPEYMFEIAENKCDTLVKYEGTWQFDPYSDYGNCHFTPIYFPDGEYITAIEKSDLWTPAGAISATLQTKPITIKGNAYDDWHINH